MAGHPSCATRTATALCWQCCLSPISFSTRPSERPSSPWRTCSWATTCTTSCAQRGSANARPCSARACGSTTRSRWPCPLGETRTLSSRSSWCSPCLPSSRTGTQWPGLRTDSQCTSRCIRPSTRSRSTSRSRRGLCPDQPKVTPRLCGPTCLASCCRTGGRCSSSAPALRPAWCRRSGLIWLMVRSMSRRRFCTTSRGRTSGTTSHHSSTRSTSRRKRGCP
uniref:Uncharacterized protein n=1 Tax=Ixodes ricinus TaxID=34613 RepID=A0A6B0V3K6_IXORI